MVLADKIKEDVGNTLARGTTPRQPAGCLGVLMLICVLLAAGVVVWNQPGWRGAGRVAAAAERLRTRLETADADGTLTDREITEAPGRARSSPGPP